MSLPCDPLCRFADRLYFTTFPHPVPSPHVINRMQGSNPAPPIRTKSRIGPQPVSPDDDATYYYFTVDNDLVYLSFFEDWGPLNLAMVYKACILIHELLEDDELKSHRLVLYSSNDPRRKANAALLMALYVMIVQRRAPWEAFHPVAELEFMPFRDAGRGYSDFNLSIQDCLWGVWKAMQNGLCDMNEFSVEDYEFYEKVENGDWNWITPGFIAFASPVESVWMRRTAMKDASADVTAVCASPARGGATAGTLHALQRKLPTPFMNCLDYFEQRNVKLVVRLNNMLYDKNHFVERNIRHEELYFDDGTNPTDEIVRKFIDMADEIIEAGGAVAVHCKAGLGRTGTLIGAYLIWKYGFTAHEAIGFMRIVRPGSVVGPQQQYLYVKQLEFAKWAAVDELRKNQTTSAMATMKLVAPATPPAEVDDPFDSSQEMPVDVLAANTTVVVMPPAPIISTLPPVTPSKHVSAAAARAGAISPPGQPRKTPVTKRPAMAVDHDSSEEDDEVNALPALSTAIANGRMTRSKVKRPAVRTVGAGGVRTVPASDQRPTRTTRAATSAAALGRKPAGLGTTSTKANGQNPNKIPRLAKDATARTIAPTVDGVPARTTRAAARAPSPTPSRLPTLVSKRAHHTHSTPALPTKAKMDGSNLPDGVAASPMKSTSSNMSILSNSSTSSDAWMKTNPSAVVVPGTKSGRPGLRPIRRRRSSFSSADVVA